MPFIMALGIGLSVSNTKAVIEAFWTRRQYRRGEAVRNEFVRTPKYAAAGRVAAGFKSDNITRPSAPAVWTLAKLAVPILELAFGVYISCFIFISIYYRYALFGLPFLLIFAAGYFYVGGSSLWVLWRMHRESRQGDVQPAVAA